MGSVILSICCWIITALVTKALISHAAPYQTDPFHGIDNFDDDKSGDSFQMKLLEKLGVRDPMIPPSINRKDIVIPDHIMAKYSSLLKHHRVKRKSITQGVHEHEGIRGTVVSANVSRHVYTFNMSSIPAGSELMMAELRVYKQLPNQSTRRNSTNTSQHNNPVRGALVSIHRIERDNIEEEQNEETNQTTTTVKVDERVVSVGSTGWKNFDVTSTVNQWMTTPSTNLGLELHVDPERPNDHAKRVAARVRFSPEGEPRDEENGVPILTVYTVKYAPNHAPVDCSYDGSDNNRCCRIPKYVDFRQTSWADRWIIEPAGFEAYDCTGPCRASNTHRSARDIFELIASGSINHKTCGVSDSSSLPMMYLIERDGVSELEVEEIPNMIAEECKCTT